MVGNASEREIQHLHAHAAKAHCVALVGDGNRVCAALPPQTQARAGLPSHLQHKLEPNIALYGGSNTGAR